MLSPSVVTIVLIVVSLLLFGYTVFIHLKMRRFLEGADGTSLEPLLHKNKEYIDTVQKEHAIVSTRLDTLEKKMKQAVRAVETVRFNPFVDQGSNQSFATALLDEEGNGVVISSLYGRERVSIFAKPIQETKSTYELTVEEKQVITSSKKKQYGN